MKTYLIYVTTGDKDEARRIGNHLVQSRLVACVNIFEYMNSIYMWEGKLQDDQETVMIAKTTEEMVPSVIENVEKLHSYECPCVLALPVEDGNPSFLGWISEQVGKPL
jgi:periplasmic divalent cation tolerance protein